MWVWPHCVHTDTVGEAGGRGVWVWPHCVHTDTAGEAGGRGVGVASLCTRSQVNGELWDLDRTLEGSCSLQLLKFEDSEGAPILCGMPGYHNPSPLVSPRLPSPPLPSPRLACRAAGVLALECPHAW